MAEFKLGRIRFIWKGDWTPQTDFLKDDIVRHGGNVYLCINGHTSSDLFSVDRESFWNRLSEGQEWKGDWETEKTYKVNDIVKYGGYLYIANTEHVSAPADSISVSNATGDGETVTFEFSETDTILFEEGQEISISNIIPDGYNGVFTVVSATTSSVTVESTFDEDYDVDGNILLGLEVDQAKWDLYAEGFDYQAEWTALNQYKVNDIVKYGSTIYICTEAHTSAISDTEGLEADSDKWDIFSKGLDWKGDWAPEFRYRVNDTVRYGGQIYVCNTGHQSADDNILGLEQDQSKWDYLHKGVEFKEDWQSDTRYKINDLVKYGSGIWICTEYHTSNEYFVQDESKWSQFVEGLEFEDSWNTSERYQPGDVVSFGGYLYASKTNNQDSKPIDNPADWDLFNTGFRFRGEWAEDSSNQEYKVGDVVRLGGYSYLCIETHDSEERPPNTTYWQQLNPGIEWKDAWADSVFYDAGDAVTITLNEGETDEVTNSYICVLAHTSDENVEQNRPDQDTTGTYWNLLAGGAENNVLTTQGDILYYSGVGPSRLPIGEAGQVLKINDTATAPEWSYLGRIDNIFYVEATAGQNLPAPTYGATPDQPWRSIGFAAYEIERGALRPNSRALLERNNAFVINETLEWVNDQIAEGSGIWEGFVNDDEYLTLVEFNKVFDSVLYDLTHNGNEETRYLTLTYFDNGSLVTELQNEDEQFVAAIEYMETVIDAVLSNFEIGTDVGTKYSAFEQTIDSSFTEESDAQSTVNDLLDIVTVSVSAGTNEDIPTQRIPNNTISVKTGTFEEVLPISVPKLTAVVGDELRSTRIEPAGSIIDQSDVPYSIEVLENIGTNINALVSGDNEGNATADGLSSFSQESPDTSLAISDSAVAADASGLAQQIIDYIDWAINGVTGDSTEPKITGSNDATTDILYTYASEIIEKNREYLKAEAIAYIENEYPDYNFNEDRYSRNIDRYIDAIRYDLIYTGNYKSLTAAKFYTNAVQGSKQENMFFLRNGTGLRNCTVAGLEGELSAPNEYGTRRPTAGAYASLDPGWGPADEHVWIQTRSPYVQNVSTFGKGCIGCKIDGELHDGGNDSIVANDFTQILSDGIGAWCTNLGRTELVSVFSYYGYMGYLAENGGKIRATNGNSSYGTFGTVAEGVDETEVPITGEVDNRAFEANVNRVITDGDQILAFEFGNAGQDYSDTTTSIKQVSIVSGAVDSNRIDGYYTGVVSNGASGSGEEFIISVLDGVATVQEITKGGTGYTEGDVLTISNNEIGGEGDDLGLEVTEIGPSAEFIVTGEGFNAEIDSVQVVDSGVFQVRMLDLNDSTDEFGGDDYFTSESTAQGGDTTSITLSNTETAIPSQLLGLALFITQGLGGGQYGVIADYNAGTKKAEIGDSAVGLLATTETVSSDTVTVESTVELATNDTVRFIGTAFGGLQTGVDYVVESVVDSTTVQLSQNGSDPGFTAGETGTMSLFRPGWDLVAPGAISVESSLDASTVYSIEPRVVIDPPAGGTYSTGAKGRALVDDEKVVQINLFDPGSGYTTAPAVTIEDPNNTKDAPTEARIGDGVLTQPTWVNRGQAFETAQADVVGDGFADNYQPGEFVRVKNLSDIPQAGSNFVLDSLSGRVFKLVVIRQLVGSGIDGDEPPFTAQFQISPLLSISEAPEDNTEFELRIRYSQVRLTGHDFLDIGTGNFEETNYPNEPEYEPDPESETKENGGGRVFYTSTDQDGNFRVGDLFSVEQSTGVATLNADAFNISGLNELSLGELGLGNTGVTITEFSADGTFTADSDSVVPTQKAIKTYITSQIGGGAATLNVNSITAGEVQIVGREITTVTGNEIVVQQKMNFEKGIDGVPAALNYFLSQ